MTEESPEVRGARAANPWWGALAIVIAVAAFAVYQSAATLALFLVALALGVWALVMALRRGYSPGRRRTSSFVVAAALVAAVVLVIATVVSVNAERNRPRLVSLEAAGADIMKVGYQTATEDFSEIWGSGDRHSFLASGTRTTVRVEAMIGFEEAVTCAIYIDNELVVSESSSSGVVTCTYVYPWL